MRWLVTLQVAAGLGALFGLAYQSVDGVVGPVTSEYADTAAQAEARAASADLSITWKSALDAQQRVVRRLADTQALASTGTIFGRSARTRGLTLALEAAVAQAGGEGRAAVLDLNSAPVVDSEGAALLGGSLAAQAAVGGAAAVRLEMLDGRPHVVAAAPLLMKGDLQGALVVATPLGAARLRSWTRALPAGTWVAVTLDNKVVVQSAPEGSLAALAAGQAVVDIAEEPHAIARRPAAGGEGVQVLGFAPIRSEGAQAAVQQVQLLVLVLGGLAFLLVAILLMLMPDGTADAKEDSDAEQAPASAAAPEASAPASQPGLSLDFPSRPQSADQPAAPPPSGTGVAAGVPPPREGGLDLQQAFAQKTVPSHPAPAGQAPALAPDAPVGPTASQDFEAPVGGERSPFAKPSGVMPAAAVPAPTPSPTFPPPPAAPPAPTAPPAPVAPAAPATPEFTPRQSAILTAPATPSMGSAAAASAPAAASPFDAIASAAMSASPPPASRVPSSAPPTPAMEGSADNLPAPKGGVPPEMVAAQRAQEQRAAHTRPPEPSMAGFSPTPYDPELPAPKGPIPSSRPATPSLAPSPATEPPRQPPGATEPPAPAIPLPGGAQPAQNPWRNPSVPAMNAPQPPKPSATTQYPVNAPTSPPSTSVPAVSGAGPYDESHYRTVYNEFVSSKAELGEAVENITYEGFRAKLRTSEQQLLERHQCRAVRFQVIVRDRTVSLRPQLLR